MAACLLPGAAWLAALACRSARTMPGCRPRERLRRASTLPPPDRPALSAQDKTELAEVLKLKAEAGDKVWPGLAAADLPIILFNARYEFLVGRQDLPGPWKSSRTKVFRANPTAAGQPIIPQNFAVKVGTAYAGSASSLELMNMQRPDENRPGFPRRPGPPRDVPRLSGRSGCGALRPGFGGLSGVEKIIPSRIRIWPRPGSLKARPWPKRSRPRPTEEAVRLAQKFLGDPGRRAAAPPGFPLNSRDYERELEWLEGAGQVCGGPLLRAGGFTGRSNGSDQIQTGASFLSAMGFRPAGKTDGRPGNDLRFYLSGMAQARLLDRLSPEWKSRTAVGKVYLEGVLRSATSKNNMARRLSSSFLYFSSIAHGLAVQNALAGAQVQGLWLGLRGPCRRTRRSDPPDAQNR